MRLSLLLKREPFGKILVDTLQDYWRTRTSLEHTVQWFPRKPDLKLLDRDGLQGWYGNIYMNYFVVPDTSSDALENLRREYARATAWWCRMPQRIYVECATRQPMRTHLSQVAFGVTPMIENATDSVVLGGNRRLRIQHPSRRVSTVILKRGFPEHYFWEDMHIRQSMSLDVAPSLYRVSESGKWYEEELIEGSPLNRLPRKEAEAMALMISGQILAKLIEPTIESVRLRDYVEHLTFRLEHLVSNPNALPVLGRQVKVLMDQSREIASGFESTVAEIPVSVTHGDFQPANVLCNSDGIKVIDWECVGHRHAAYDALVFALCTRQNPNWALRFVELLSGALPHLLRGWPGLGNNLQERRVTLLVFLLEELLFVLNENWEVSFIIDSVRLPGQLRQIERSIRVLAIK